MKQFLIAMTLTLLCACNTSGAPQNVSPAVNVMVTTVDGERNEFKAEEVSWWYVNQRETQTKLRCEEEMCSAWTIGNEVAGAITISAHTSRVKENDDQCWDWYEGEAAITADPSVPQKVSIVMSYRATACT